MKTKVIMVVMTVDTHLIKEEEEDRHTGEDGGDDDDTHLIKEQEEDRHEDKGEDGGGRPQGGKEQTTGDHDDGCHHIQSHLDCSLARQ